MMATCQECVHFDDGMCKLKPGACLNYDHFQWYPMIMISPSDLENKYVSRISYDSLLKRAKAAEAKVAELEAATRWISVDERLPEKSYADIGDEKLVELSYPYNLVTTMKFRRDDDLGKAQWFTGGYGCPLHDWTKRVIRWCELPQPPKPEGEK